MPGTTFTWIGSNGPGDWATPFDWNPAGVPGGADTAVFPEGQSNVAVVNGSQSAAELDLFLGTVSILANQGLAIGQFAIIDNGVIDVAAGASLGIGAVEPAGTGDLSVGDFAGTFGTISVSGQLTSATEAFVGYDGSGLVTVSNGGSLAINDGTYALLLANSPGSSGTLQLLAGAHATLLGEITDGYAGIGSIEIAGGSVLSNSVSSTYNVAATVGSQPGSAGSMVVVSDPGSQWVLGGGMELYGSSTLEVLNGGALYAASPAAGGTYTLSTGSAAGGPSDTGVIVVSGPGSVVNTGAGSIGVGYDAIGVMFVQQGAQVFATQPTTYNGFTLGETSTGDGFLTVSDAGSLVNVTGQFEVGRDGQGSATIENGATISTGNLDGSAGVVIGAHAGGSGTVVVTGSGSALVNAGRLWVGDQGSGTLEVLAGATVTTTRDPALGGALSVSFDPGSSGTVLVSGAGSRLDVVGNAFVGDNGAGALFVNDGGSVDVSLGVYVAETSAAQGVVIVDGASLTAGGDLYDGSLPGVGGSWYFQAVHSGRVAIGGSALLVSNALLSVDASSAIDIGGATAPVAGVIQVEAGASISGEGTVAGIISNLGLIAADAGGRLLLQGPVSGGAYAVSNGSTLSFAGPVFGIAQLAFDATGGTLELGAGASTVDSGAGPGVIATGAGQSALVFARDGNTVLAQGRDTVVAGSGAETVAVSGAGALLFASAGQLSVSALGVDTTLVGGVQGLTLMGATGGGEVFGSTTGVNLLHTGDGPTTLVGGGSGDILAAGNASNDLLVAGSGAETLDGSASSAFTTMFAGAGPDSLAGGSGTSLMLAGTGQAVMAGGGGGNIFAFVDGAAGGADTITGFDASRDLVVLFGYAAGEGAGALSHATVQGGSLVLGLSDGTQITFLGTTALPASSLVG